MSSYQFSLAAKELFEIRHPTDSPISDEELVRLEQMYNDEEVDSIFSAVKKVKQERQNQNKRLA